MTRARVIVAMIVLMLFRTPSVLAWGDDGHRIVAYIAAAHLTPAAQQHIGRTFQVDAKDPAAVADAMARESLRPDHEFRPEDKSTAPWHFVDLCLQDTEADLGKRCDRGCITAKIDEYEARLRRGSYDKWGADGDLAFLIHFLGDIHQPLHDTTNADKGANCVNATIGGYRTELHAVWDTILIRALEGKLQVRLGVGGDQAAAQALGAEYRASPPTQSLVWRPGRTADIAWEATQIARNKIYRELNLKEEPCQTAIFECAEAPVEVQSEIIALSPGYMSDATDVAGRQLYIAGMRLASLLNQLWP